VCASAQICRLQKVTLKPVMQDALATRQNVNVNTGQASVVHALGGPIKL
jgi:hypothetical protein